MGLEDVQHRVQQAWVNQQWDEWRASCARTYTFRLTPTMALDAEQTLNWSQAWFTAFPDYREVVRSVFTSAGSVAYELIGSGTSTADLTLFGATVIPHSPGANFAVRYVKILDIDADDLVTEDRQYVDSDALRVQLASTRHATS